MLYRELKNDPIFAVDVDEQAYGKLLVRDNAALGEQWLD